MILQVLLVTVSLRIAAADVITSNVTITGDCLAPGLTCDSTSKNVGVCTEDASGVLSFTLVKTCGPGLSCDPTTGGCSSTHSVRAGTILCGTSGLFPNPYNCKQSFFCSGPGVLPVYITTSCGTNLAYDACSKECDKYVPNDMCSYEELCTTYGEIHVLADNPRIYYICTADGAGGLAPSMNYCEHGYYDVSQGRCIPSSYGCCYNISPPPCTKEGEIFPDPYNCAGFLYCNASLELENISCAAGHHFDTTLGDCIAGAC